MVEHVAITDPEIHEPVGVKTANANEVYVADGAASGSWLHLNPFGGWRYNNIGTGTTFTTPTAYTLMSIVGATSTLKNMTNNSLGRLTYSGTPNRQLEGVFDVSFKHSVGADVFFAVYKNGALLSQNATNVEMVDTAVSTNYHRCSISFDAPVVTNDYFEIYLKSASGNVVIHTAYLWMKGSPG